MTKALWVCGGVVVGVVSSDNCDISSSSWLRSSGYRAVSLYFVGIFVRNEFLW